MSEISDLKAAVFRIETALAGDPKYGTGGLVRDIHDIKETQRKQGTQIQEIKRKLFKEKVVVGAVSTAVAGTSVWFGKAWLLKLGAFLSSLKP